MCSYLHIKNRIRASQRVQVGAQVMLNSEPGALRALSASPRLQLPPLCKSTFSSSPPEVLRQSRADSWQGGRPPVDTTLRAH